MEKYISDARSDYVGAVLPGCGDFRKSPRAFRRISNNSTKGKGILLDGMDGRGIIYNSEEIDLEFCLMECSRCGAKIADDNLANCPACRMPLREEDIDTLVDTAYLCDVPGKEKFINLTWGKSYVIGRQDSADIVLPNSTVSRAHARIEWDGGQFFITDLNAANGTFINKVRVQKGPLIEGDILSIGPFDMNYTTKEPGQKIWGDAETESINATQVFDPESLGAQPSAMRGDLAKTNLVEIFQFMKSNAKNGTIRVSSEQGVGEVYIADGDIINAYFGVSIGEKAVHEMVSLCEGRFDLVSDAKPVCERTIQVDTISLLLEIMRQQDESKRGAD